MTRPRRPAEAGHRRRRASGCSRTLGLRLSRVVSGFSRMPGLRPVTTAASALALVAVLAAAGIVFGRRALLLVNLVRAGKPVRRSDDVPARVRSEAVVVLGQKKLFQRLGPGLIHAFIFWGFLVLFPTIVMALIGAVSKDRLDSLARLARAGSRSSSTSSACSCSWAWAARSGFARCRSRSGSRAATRARPT